MTVKFTQRNVSMENYVVGASFPSKKLLIVYAGRDNQNRLFVCAFVTRLVISYDIEREIFIVETVLWQNLDAFFC